MTKTILLIFGGVSSEHEVSCVSAANVAQRLDKEQFTPILLGITKDGKQFIYTGAVESMLDASWADDTKNLIPAVISPCSAHHGLIVLNKAEGTYSIKRIDAAFPVLHGANGEDGRMQGLLDMAEIPYVGCDTYSSAVCMDKVAAKLLGKDAGVPIVPFICGRIGDDYNALICESEEKFGYPVFVKPANAGSSVGITKARTRAELLCGLEKAFENDRKILIETAVVGREIEVAVLGGETPFASRCGEVIPNSDFYDYETKYANDNAQYGIPADIGADVDKKIRDFACKVFSALDCEGFARVDFFLCKDGSVYFNEINTIPGFTSISMYPKLIEQAGIPYTELITKLLTLAIGRKKVR